jgi:hypothetical protein
VTSESAYKVLVLSIGLILKKAPHEPVYTAG